MKTFSLTIHNSNGYVDKVIVKRFYAAQNTGKDALAAARSATESFVATPEGRKICNDNCEEFNWIDAFMYIPTSFWSLYGLELIDDSDDLFAEVDHDEDLVGTLYMEE